MSKTIIHTILRVVQTQAILFSKSMSDPTLSEIDFKNKMTWVRATLKILSFWNARLAGVILPDERRLFTAQNFELTKKSS